MVYTTEIDDRTRARVFFLRHVQGFSVREVSGICHVSRSSVWRIGREDSRRKSALRSKKQAGLAKRGRPSKLTDRTKRYILYCFRTLREDEGTFCIKRLMQKAGISQREVSIRTINRFLNDKKIYFLQARKKGLLTKKDLKDRVAFATAVKTDFAENFWTEKVAFYLDGTGFVFKTNPLDQARAPGARIWRKRTEGLLFGCTAKGKKEGTGGKVLKLMVAISYNKGVIICEPFEKMLGSYFAGFIDEHFNSMFEKAGKGESRLWVQDGDPCQNSALAKSAMGRANATLFQIPPRSPDLNPIENLFHLVSKRLRDNALDKRITKETYQQFQERVINTMYSIPIKTINNIIESMNERIELVIEGKGNRLKY